MTTSTSFSFIETRALLADELELALVAISMNEPHWPIKGSLGTLRSTKSLLRDEAWGKDRLADTTDDYLYAPLHLEDGRPLTFKDKLCKVSPCV